MKKIFFLFLLVSLYLTNNLNSQITVNFSDESGNPSSTVDVDITLDDFNQIVLMQYSVNWDSTQFHFNSILNVTTTLPQFSEAGNIGTPESAASVDEGELAISWSKTNTEPESLPDGHLLFTVRLDVVGVPCDESGIFLSDDPTLIEVIDEDFNSIGANSNDGALTIPGPDCGGSGNNTGLGVIASNEAVSSGDPVCVEITVDSFVNIQSAQMGFQWDPDVIDYTGVENCVLPDFLLNASNVANGSLDFLWFDNTGVNPVTLNDGDVLLELCFNAVGSGGTESTVAFVPLQSAPIEFANDQGQAVPHYTENGSVMITGSGNGTDFTLIAEGGDAEQGAETCFGISVQNFVDIQSMQFALMWDANILEYTSVQNLNLAQLSIANFNQSADNKLRVSWNDFGNGVTVPDNTVIFEICFEGVGDCDSTTDLMFTNDPPINIEISNSNNEVLPYALINSEITVVCNCGITLNTLNEPDCNGDENGSINISVGGGSGSYTITWYNDLGIIQGPGSTQDIFTIGAGTYTVEVTDGAACNTSQVFIVNEPDELAINPTLNHPGCDEAENGSISLTISGGTGAYNCSWSAGIPGSNCDANNLSAGSYSVTVTDENGCTISATYELDGKDDFAVEGIITDEVEGCDGEIELDFTAGVMPFTFVWSDNSTTGDRTDLCKGEYCVTVTDNVGCEAVNCFTVDPKPLEIEIETIEDADCFGEATGSINLVVSGGCPDGNGNYSFAWDGPAGPYPNTANLENLIAGNYTVTITDFSVPVEQIIAMFTVGQPDEIIITALIISSNGNDGEIDITISGSIGLSTIEWDNGEETEDIENLEGGTYSVTVTDSNGCTSEDSFYVPWSFININVIDPNDVYNGFGVSCVGMCDGVLDASLQGGNPPFNYTLDGEQVSLPVSDLCAGSYTLVVMDASGLTSSEVVEIFEPEALSVVVDTILCSKGNDGSITVTAQGGVPTYDFNWGEFGSGPSIFNLEALAQYTVIVSDLNGCEVMLSNIEVEACIKANCFVGSEVITPNGDAYNEYFKIACAEDINGDLHVYDRWGREVYFQQTYDNSWNGLDKDGNELIEGGYMWVLSVNTINGKNYYKGSITILRDSY